MSAKKKNNTDENSYEKYFRWYLEELKDAGYIKSFSRETETILVSPAIEMERKVYMKTKEKIESFVFMQPITYTYDFRIIWDFKAFHLFTEIIDKNKPFEYYQFPFKSHKIVINDVLEIVSYVDVKPHSAAVKFGGGKNMTFYTFPFIQKMLFEKHDFYINKIIPINTGKHGVNTCLFATTFVPNRYLYTDQSGALRTIKFRKTPLVSYVKKMESYRQQIKAIKAGYDSQTKLL